MLYHDKYYFWQEVPVTTATGYEMTISDMNENGLPEIYGRTRDYEDPWSMPMRVYELNAENNFDYKMIFSDCY